MMTIIHMGLFCNTMFYVNTLGMEVLKSRNCVLESSNYSELSLANTMQICVSWFRKISQDLVLRWLAG